MLKSALTAVFAPLLGMMTMGGGFYLLYIAFLDGLPLPGFGGGILILLGAWLMALARRAPDRLTP
jgi:hypothetical protein